VYLTENTQIAIVSSMAGYEQTTAKSPFDKYNSVMKHYLVNNPEDQFRERDKHTTVKCCLCQQKMTRAASFKGVLTRIV